MVDEASVDEVDAIDEELRSPHGLDEVGRSPHLGQELDEELGASVGQHAGQQTVDGSDQAVLGADRCSA